MLHPDGYDARQFLVITGEPRMRSSSFGTTVQTIFTIGIAGFIGANVRYWLSLWIGDVVGRAYPYGTLLINTTGSALLGLFLAWAGKQIDLDPQIKLFIAVGFFGAYTTFSSFATETIALIQRGEWGAALIYAGATNVLCLVGAAAGVWLGGRL